MMMKTTQATAGNHKTGVRISLYLLMFGFGLTLTAIAPMMPYIIEQFRLTLSQGSLFNLFNNLGGFFGIVLVVFFSDRYKKSRFFLAGYAIFVTGLIVISIINGYYLLLATFFIMGMGARIVDVLGNPIIVENFPEKSDKYLSMLHMFISLGGLVSPLLVSLLLGLGMNWQTVFQVIGLYCLITVLASTFVLKNTVTVKRQVTPHPSGERLINDRLLWVVGIIIALYSGHQSIINVWSAMFMEKTFLLSTFKASFSTTALWIGIAAGRLIYSKVQLPFNAKQIIKYGALIGGVLLTVSVFLPSSLVIFIAFGIVGLFTGAIFPLLMDLVTQKHPTQSGRVSAIMYICSIVSVMLFPWIAGTIGDVATLSMGISVSGVALLALFIAACFL